MPELRLTSSETFDVPSELELLRPCNNGRYDNNHHTCTVHVIEPVITRTFPFFFRRVRDRVNFQLITRDNAFRSAGRGLSA